MVAIVVVVVVEVSSMYYQKVVSQSSALRSLMNLLSHAVQDNDQRGHLGLEQESFIYTYLN